MAIFGNSFAEIVEVDLEMYTRRIVYKRSYNTFILASLSYFLNGNPDQFLVKDAYVDEKIKDVYYMGTLGYLGGQQIIFQSKTPDLCTKEKGKPKARLAILNNGLDVSYIANATILPCVEWTVADILKFHVIYKCVSGASLLKRVNLSSLTLELTDLDTFESLKYKDNELVVLNKDDDSGADNE